jgi:glycine/D-amino acid oxidase-like deaminating enzyme
VKRREIFGAALVGLSQKSPRAVAGGFADRSLELGHRLRDGKAFPPGKESRKTGVAIVGAGIAGLSAAWWLQRAGFTDFSIIEMEERGGGNSRWGENAVSAYPWGAHYLPLPSQEAHYVRLLMEELGVLRGGVWDERHLCHSPKERLYLHGRWQDGLEPETGATHKDHQQYARFQARMGELAASGQFRIPVEEGPRPAAALDQTTMRDWMRANGFDSPYLNWLADYSCRDDYGCGAASVSAWAGIHYFAARQKENEQGPLTWPEGNGWIVKRLLEKLGGRVRTGEFLFSIERRGRGWLLRTSMGQWQSGAVIFAAPTYLAHYLMPEHPRADFVYSPWLTANLTLENWPEERGIPAAWDNVIYNSPSLGYVVATHQSLRSHVPKTVWTYYWALAEYEPAEARRLLLERDWNWWKERIITDLEKAHPDIRRHISRLDIMRLGHAMVRPAPGFYSRGVNRHWTADRPGIYFANSDLSGISIFEEAQYRGVQAAQRVLRRVSR